MNRQEPQPAVPAARAPCASATPLLATAQHRPDALVVWRVPMLINQDRRVSGLAPCNLTPAFAPASELVDAGGLMSYGLNVRNQFERTAEYMQRIFQGRRPTDLPVEQPTRFEPVINRKAATVPGIAIPHELLLRAEEVIE